MEGKKLSKKEIKEYCKQIDKLKYEGHKHEQFRQVIYFKKGKTIEDGVYLPFLVSSYGRIFSLNYHMQKGLVRELTPSVNTFGYKQLILYSKGAQYNARVNRLVAIAFKKNKDYLKYDEVNHIDCDTLNNCKWNLNWMSSKQNVHHSFKMKTRTIQYGENANSSKYKEKDIRKVCEMLEKGIPIMEISRKTKVRYDPIQSVLYKRHWTTVSCDYDFSNTVYWKNKK